MAKERNILGGPLKSCCKDPLTGFYRNGRCSTGPEDIGKHLVCVQMTEAFLAFSQEKGNDLSTPKPDFDFPGLKPGDRWCLCADRWQEAYEAGVAPPIIPEATHEAALQYIPMTLLHVYALQHLS